MYVNLVLFSETRRVSKKAGACQRDTHVCWLIILIGPFGVGGLCRDFDLPGIEVKH